MQKIEGKIIHAAIEPFAREDMLEEGMRWFFRHLGDPQYGGHCVFFLRKEAEEWKGGTPDQVRVPDVLVTLEPDGQIIKMKNPSNHKFCKFSRGIPKEPFLVNCGTMFEILGL